MALPRYIFQKSQRYKAENGKIKLVDNTLGQENMGDPETLSSFIKFCTKKYKADRYGLILWDHGGAIGGVCYDENFNIYDDISDNLITAELGKALKAGKTKFDFIGFDACYMANLETILAVANYTDYVVAAETVIPGTSWYYTDWIKNLCGNTSLKTQTIGKNIVDSYLDSLNSYGISGSGYYNLSVIDTKAVVKNVIPALAKFSRQTDKMLTDKKYTSIVQSINNSKQHEEYADMAQLVDMNLLASYFGTDHAVALGSALSESIVYTNKNCYGYSLQGISITLPFDDLTWVDYVSDVYDYLGYDTKDYIKFIKHFANIMAGGQQYYDSKNKDYKYSGCKWLDKKQFYSDADYKKMFISKKDEYVPYYDVEDEYGKRPAVPFLSDEIDRNIIEFGIEHVIVNTTNIYLLGRDNTLYYNDDGFFFGTNGNWFIIENEVVAAYFLGREDYYDNYANYYYTDYYCTKCKIGNKPAYLYFTKSKTDTENDLCTMMYYTPINDDGTPGRAFEVTSGLKIKPLYNAMDNNGNEYEREGYTITIKSPDNIWYGFFTGLLGNKNIVSRLYFIDVFGIVHYTEELELDPYGYYT